MTRRNPKVALTDLGYADYPAYLASPEWWVLRERVMERDSRRCRACRAPAAHVHHVTYNRIGREHLNDLLALCADCHERVHAVQKAGVSLRSATKRVVRERETPGKVVLPPARRPSGKRRKKRKTFKGVERKGALSRDLAAMKKRNAKRMQDEQRAKRAESPPGAADTTE